MVGTVLNEGNVTFGWTVTYGEHSRWVNLKLRPCHLNEVQAKRHAVVIIKRGKPVAKLVPVEREKDDIFGFFNSKGKIEINGDRVAPAFTPEEWGDLYFDPASEVAEKKKS